MRLFINHTVEDRLSLLIMTAGTLAQRGGSGEYLPVDPTSLPIDPTIKAAPTPAAPPTIETTFEYPIRPRIKGPCRKDPELFEYIADRRTDMATREENPSDRFLATVNFEHPLTASVFRELLQRHDVTWVNLRYVTNTDIWGGCGACTLAGAEADLRASWGDNIRIEGVTSVEAYGTLSNLRRLAEEPTVLLVDLGPKIPSSGFTRPPEFPLTIFGRYERTCTAQGQ